MNLHTQHLQLVLTSSNSVDVKLSGLCGQWLYHPSTHPSLHPSICTFIPTTNLQVFINFSLYPSPQVTKTNTVSSRQARELIFPSLCQYLIFFHISCWTIKIPSMWNFCHHSHFPNQAQFKHKNSQTQIQLYNSFKDFYVKSITKVY